MIDDMTSGVEVEGLSPWITSGELCRLLEYTARWYDAADEDTDLAIEIRPWEIHDRADLTLRPCLRLLVTHGPKGYRGAAEVFVWRGADPEAVPAALAEAAGASRAAHEQRRRDGSLSVGVRRRIEVAAPDRPRDDRHAD
jgi:hypothetical protein